MEEKIKILKKNAFGKEIFGYEDKETLEEEAERIKMETAIEDAHIEAEELERIKDEDRNTMIILDLEEEEREDMEE